MIHKPTPPEKNGAQHFTSPESVKAWEVINKLTECVTFLLDQHTAGIESLDHKRTRTTERVVRTE